MDLPRLPHHPTVDRKCDMDRLPANQYLITRTSKWPKYIWMVKPWFWTKQDLKWIQGDGRIEWRKCLCNTTSSPFRGCGGDWVEVCVEVHTGAVFGDASMLNISSTKACKRPLKPPTHLDPISCATSEWRIDRFHSNIFATGEKKNPVCVLNSTDGGIPKCKNIKRRGDVMQFQTTLSFK